MGTVVGGGVTRESGDELLKRFLPGVSVFTSTSMTTADGLLAGMSIVEVAAGWRRPAWSGRVPEPNKILHTIQVVQIH